MKIGLNTITINLCWRTRFVTFPNTFFHGCLTSIPPSLLPSKHGSLQPRLMDEVCACDFTVNICPQDLMPITDGGDKEWKGQRWRGSKLWERRQRQGEGMKFSHLRLTLQCVRVFAHQWHQNLLCVFVGRLRELIHQCARPD